MYEYIAVVRSVYDSDTFRADVDLGFGVWTSNVAFRLLGIQGWELGSAKGRAARDAARTLMPVGAEVLIRTRKDEREKYGRMLATVLCEVGDVGEALIAGGHAVAWDGTGPRPETPVTVSEKPLPVRLARVSPEDTQDDFALAKGMGQPPAFVPDGRYGLTRRWPPLPVREDD